MRIAFQVCLAALVVLTGTLLFGGTPGSFRGTVVESEDGTQSPGWIYVRGRNGSIRRVDIRRAKVDYDPDSGGEHPKNAANDLRPGTEVRVTAEQGDDGEWKASRVEVLKPAASSGATHSSMAADGPDFIT